MRNTGALLSSLLVALGCASKGAGPGMPDAAPPAMDSAVSDGAADVRDAAAETTDAGPPPCVPGFVGAFPSVEAGDHPRAVVIADFDRDGRLDVAVVANYPQFNRNFLTIARGDGRGGFGAPDQITIGTFATSLVAGDFNGDGAPDLAVGLQGTAGVQVLINHGDGTFGNATMYATTSGPDSMVAVDLDGDQRIDLVTSGSGLAANTGARGLSVLKGNGDGTFQAMRDYPVGGEPAGVAVGDVNGDHILDVVVADRMFQAGAVKTLLGQGGIDLGPPTITSMTAGALAVALADVDEDHHLDAVVGTNLGVVVMRGLGDGTFAAPLSLSNDDSSGIAVADLDGDGHLDVVATSGTWFDSNGATVAVARGFGDGTFMPFASYEAGTWPVAVAIGDLTGDGRPDLVVADNGGDTATLLAATAGGFTQPANWSTPVPNAVAVADVTGDGRPDVVTSSGQVLAGLAGGGLAAPMNQASGRNTVTLPDWTGDGLPDLVRDGDSMTVLVNPGLGDGTFGAQVSLPAPTSVVRLASGDFDGDGHADLAVLDVAPSNLNVLFGDGHGAVAATSKASVSLHYSLGVVAADFDGDQRTDFAAAEGQYSNDPTAVQIVFGSGDRTLVPGPVIDFGAFILGIAGGDVDRDGHPDLIVVLPPATGDGLTVAYQLILLRNRADGTGTFDQSTLAKVPIWSELSEVAETPLEMAVADVDGDGAPELVVLYGPRLEIWNLNGAAPATRRNIYAYGGDHLVARDLDGDGAAEVIIARASANELLLLRSGCR